MTYEDIINYEALAVYDSQIKKWVKELTPQHTEEIYNLLLSHLEDGYRLFVNELQPSRPSRTITVVYEYICNVEVDGEIYLRWDRFGLRNIRTDYDRDRFTVYTSINHEIGSGVFIINDDGEFVVESSKTVKEYSSFTFASKEDLENINLEPVTEEEVKAMWIEDPEEGYVGVFIDGEPRSLDPMFMYKEQGYPVLYYEESGTLPPESMMCSDERPNEDDERYTHYEQVSPEPEPTIVRVAIDNTGVDVDSSKTYSENGYNKLFSLGGVEIDTTTTYPQEGDEYFTGEFVNVYIDDSDEPTQMNPALTYYDNYGDILYDANSGYEEAFAHDVYDRYPNEGAHVYTYYEQLEPAPTITVFIDGVSAEVDGSRTWAENGYTKLYDAQNGNDSGVFHKINMNSLPAEESEVWTTYSVNDDNVVDLELPSGTLWCKNNFGATTQEGVGPYFPWGKKDGYTPNAQGVFDQAYFTFANYPTLPDAVNNDPIAEQTDGAYRMPTAEDYEELYNNTTITSVFPKKGFTYTAANGASIFIPRTKFGENNTLKEHTSADHPFMWINSPKDEYTKRAILDVNDYPRLYEASKFYGMQLRGVKS